MNSDLATLNSLNRILANLYPVTSEALRVASGAGLPVSHIDFSGKSISTWYSIVDQAKLRGKLDDLVSFVLLEYPSDDTLLAVKANLAPPPFVDGPQPKWSIPDAAKATLEKIIGSRSALVPISSLELGLRRSRSVARVRLSSGGLGTGFLIAGNRLITNNHVLPDKDSARSAIAQFNYQKTTEGLDAPIEEFALSPEDLCHTSKDDDWTVVSVATDASHWGHIELASASLKVGDFVNIIQHAGGGPKQLSFAANTVAFVGTGRVQYLTDTLPGSSGSPVFDQDWSLVALHHSGGWLPEPNSPSKSTFYRNEGISVDVLISAIGRINGN